MDILIPKKKWSFVTRWWWLGALILAGTAMAGLYWPQPGQRLHVAASRLTISSVTRGNFQEFTAIDGVVQPLRTVYLDAAEAGTVQQVLVEEGTTLTAGQPLLRLANPDLQLEMVNRETAVFDLMNNLQNTRNQLLQNRILRQTEWMSRYRRKSGRLSPAGGGWGPWCWRARAWPASTGPGRASGFMSRPAG